MPNWCSCDLEVLGEKEQIEKFANDFYDAQENSFSMKKLLPLPGELETDYAPVERYNLKEEYVRNSPLFKNVTRVNEIESVEPYKDFVIVGLFKEKKGNIVTIDSWGEEFSFEVDGKTVQDTYYFKDSFLIADLISDGNMLRCKAVLGNDATNPNLYEPIKKGTFAYNNNIYSLDEITKNLTDKYEEDLRYIKTLIEEVKDEVFDIYIPFKSDNEALLIPFDIAIIGKIAGNVSTITGYNSWYDWNIENYGTKWDHVTEYSLEEFIRYGGLSYETAWGPNEAFYLNISSKYPELTFKLNYVEEGAGFLGECEIKNGVYLKNEFYDSSKDYKEYYKKLIEINGEDYLETILFEYDFDEDFIIELYEIFDVDEELKNDAIKECRNRASGE
ncbi:hypothetical protein [Clostridium sp.]|uniref:DUF1281 family ferredoxin-like fold protein n=1 Tax=Clostridium sp. TaxID=1506 RepID=UPI001B6CBE1B|nr:hypothetical protein [Clostridium sp.]MBP3917345.1 hypothetical protein [Clostridium sp.]